METKEVEKQKEKKSFLLWQVSFWKAVVESSVRMVIVIPWLSSTCPDLVQYETSWSGAV